jgi:hypothetical protein
MSARKKKFREFSNKANLIYCTVLYGTIHKSELKKKSALLWHNPPTKLTNELYVIPGVTGHQ